jgi:hypothetical protein
MENSVTELVLYPGEIHRQQKYGSNAISRGAVLIDCDWDGGRFESGLFMGGIFRGGEFSGGTFLGGIFLAGMWIDGVWIGGFDREGFYLSRGVSPATR